MKRRSAVDGELVQESVADVEHAVRCLALLEGLLTQFQDGR